MGKGGVPSLPFLIPSQANNILPNGLTPSSVFIVTNNPVVNDNVSPYIIYPYASFTAEFFSAVNITDSISEVYGPNVLFVALDKTLN